MRGLERVLVFVRTRFARQERVLAIRISGYTWKGPCLRWSRCVWRDYRFLSTVGRSIAATSRSTATMTRHK